METKKHYILESPAGLLTLVKTDGLLSGLYLPDHLRGPGEDAMGSRAYSGFEEEVEQLQQYFAKQRTEFTLQVTLKGTPFQQRVWALLRRIPYGSTRSYTDLAVELGDGSAVRAVGSSNARNPISVIVPCHRVIGSKGTLTGYAGGLDCKRFLLELEGALEPTLPNFL